MKYFLFFFSICLVLSCKDMTTQPDPPKENDLAELRGSVAEHVADNFVIPAFDVLNTRASELHQQALLLSDEVTEENLDALRTAHRQVWEQWQRASLFQFGPSVTNGLRVALNTYPTDAEKIEANISSGNYQPGALTNQDAEGLPALDYLLRNQGDPQPLSDFSPERIAYIQTLTERIQTLITNTTDEWKNGIFIQNFKSTNATGTDVGSAMGLLVNAIDLHFQRFVRDGKIAIPGGIRSAGVTRPQSVEALYGQYSTELLLISLRTYQDYFAGKGFNDNRGPMLLEYLEALDQEVLSERINSNFDKLIASAEQLSAPLSQQIETDNESVIQVFLNMQDLVAIFKSDMASVMGISITNQDNDGD